MRRGGSADMQSGQASVEAAITLPLSVFLILGTLQMFLMLQARILTEYAAFHAARTGSVKQGNCEAMTHAAIATLLPAFARTDSPAALGAAFRAHRDGRYQPALDIGYNGDIVWVARSSPTVADISATEEEDFDDPDRYLDADDVTRLETRLVFWYPMRIPFANWVLSQMFLAHMGLQDATGGMNPLMPVHRANWRRGVNVFPLETFIRSELQQRVARSEYVFPLQATYAMRMMTPPRASNFNTQNCPPTPEGL
jgi:TadE-like protein